MLLDSYPINEKRNVNKHCAVFVRVGLKWVLFDKKLDK